MKTIRKYTSKNHYSKKQGGGSFYKWIDVTFSGNKIEVCQLYSIGKGKRLPKDGSGSCTTYSIREAKILIPMLLEVILKSE